MVVGIPPIGLAVVGAAAAAADAAVDGGGFSRAAGFSPRTASRYLLKYNLSGSTYLSNPNVDIAHNKSSPLIVFRFSCKHLSLASDVMKEINSLTHSCTVSLLSLAILAFSGNVFFIIRAMLAMGRKRSWNHQSSVAAVTTEKRKVGGEFVRMWGEQKNSFGFIKHQNNPPRPKKGP